MVVASAAGILLLRTLTTGRTLPRFSERRAHGIFLGGAFFTAVLLIAVLVEAPNGSYLFSWPLASLSLALMLRGRAAAVLRPILLLGALSLLLPTFATLVQLFSVHGAFPAYLGGAGLLLIAPYLFPLLYPICRLRRSRLAFAIVSVSGVLVLTISAVLHLQGS